MQQFTNCSKYSSYGAISSLEARLKKGIRSLHLFSCSSLVELDKKCILNGHINLIHFDLTPGQFCLKK